MQNMKLNFQKIFQQAEKKRAASQFNEAIELYIKAKELSELFSREQLSCLMALGDCYRMVGRYVDAGFSYTGAGSIAHLLGEKPSENSEIPLALHIHTAALPMPHG